MKNLAILILLGGCGDNPVSASNCNLLTDEWKTFHLFMQKVEGPGISESLFVRDGECTISIKRLGNRAVYRQDYNCTLWNFDGYELNQQFRIKEYADFDQHCVAYGEHSFLKLGLESVTYRFKNEFGATEATFVTKY